MADNEELSQSVDGYKNQLAQVEGALKSTNNEGERQALESLRSDLVELVDLTLQTINQGCSGNLDQQGCDTTNTSTSSQSSCDDKMSSFMTEIKNLEATTSSAHQCDDNDENFDKKLQAIKDELQNMIGKKCSAPHNHSWGATAYHNAIICGMDESRDYELADLKCFRLRILFTNPTHREMVPCSYFLEGECKFDAERCRFSHGELIPFGELKDYKEPDFTKLKKNCTVLAKLNDRIWHKGRVVCMNFEEKSCYVRLDHQKKEIDLNFEDLFPLFNEDGDSSDSGDSCSSSEDDADLNEIRKVELIQQSLFSPATNQVLGEWEKHTKGIGSKLMQKMGYITGTGLGSNGEGIIVPISAQILPPRRSLDHCMELREAANGDKDLFSVEKKLKIDQKKQEAINRKAYECSSNQTNIFSFLNESVFVETKSVEDNNEIARKNEYKSHSTKTLNVESLKVAEDIRKKEKEIFKIKESIKRHPPGSDVFKRLQSQLAVKNKELSSLKRSENNLNKEQLSRKSKDELFVF